MSLLIPGETCLRIARAERVSVIVDAAAYYAALREAALAAQHSLFIVGWDVDSRTRLVPEDAPADGHPPTLLAFLNALLDERPALQIWVLAWDFSMIYSLEREHLATFKFGWQSHERLQFSLDAAHPVTGSQHQKLVVVDDRVAFCGGIDLTIRRWDRPEHAPDDAQRVDPKGEPYAPMHDVQLAVDGPAAAALGELARERWRRANGALPEPAASGFWSRLRAKSRRKPHAQVSAADPWPASISIDFRDVDVGIARTLPSFTPLAANGSTLDQQQSDVREVLQLNLAAIAAAEHRILIENQYLTSAAVGRALEERLGEEHGPHVFAILPMIEHGWMEQGSMGVLRARVLERLQRADRFGHLHVYHPIVDGSGETQVNVHSKVLIVDDRFLKVGSSNLSNRSMGLDAECDLAIDAQGQAHESTLRGGITAIAARLLGEHLGVATAELQAQLSSNVPLASLIAARASSPRRLQPLTAQLPDAPLNLAMLDGFVVDPERPMDADAFMDRLVPEELRKSARRSLFGVAGAIAALLGIAALWRFSALHDVATAEQLAAFATRLEAHPLSALYVWLGYLLAGALFFPITVLITGTALAFPGLTAFCYALVGCLLSACASYGVGRLLGRVTLRQLTSPRLLKLSSQFRRHGFRAMVAARLLPVGNFTAINLLAGASQVPFGAFFVGNVIGLLPGVIGLTLLADRLNRAFRQPSLLNVLALITSAIVVGLCVVWLERAIGKPGPRLRRAPALPIAPLAAPKASTPDAGE